MYRNIINELAAWHDERSHRILYLKGASGVGKTWTVNDFATAFFPSKCYVDVSASSEAFDAIASGSIEDLDAFFSKQFTEDELKHSLIILDEVQHIAGSDIFFHEYRRKHRDYALCLIASTMEITEYEYTHPDLFYMLRMRPMTFEEYMIASKAHPLISAIENEKSVPLNPFEIKAVLSKLREYLLIGGMPAIVNEYIKHKDLSTIRPMQHKLIDSYEKLIRSQFGNAMAQRCRRIFTSIPKQLEHDNKKFMYRFVDSNARSREYAEATQLLCNLGLARKLPRLIDGVFPLEEHVDYKSFELFFLDHGLLRAMFKLPINDTITLDELFAEKNGAIAEQYIFEELSSKVGYLYYWISGATARVPFVYEGDKAPIPVDIRFVPNPRAQSIRIFRSKNETDISLKISLEQVSFENNVLNIPAFGLWNM